MGKDEFHGAEAEKVGESMWQNPLDEIHQRFLWCLDAKPAGTNGVFSLKSATQCLPGFCLPIL